MKKMVKFVLSSVVLLGVCSCGNQKPNENQGGNGNQQQEILEGDVCTKLEIVKMPNKLTYKSGEIFSPVGLEFNAIYENGYKGDYGLEAGDLDGRTPTGALTQDVKEVEILFENCTAKIPITVESKTLLEVKITREPDVKTYNVGEALKLGGMIVQASYEEGVIEDEKNYVVTDKDGKVYEEGTVLDKSNDSLELFVSVSSNGVTKKDSFKIGVFGGITLQVEDKIDPKKDERPNNKSYTTINEKQYGYCEFKQDCTFTGSGYLGSVSKNCQIIFNIYSPIEIEEANLVLVGSSTLPGEGKMEDMIFNQMFEATIGEGENVRKLNVGDEVIFPGKEFPPAGSAQNKWTNWADVNIGKVKLNKGFTVITLTCIGTIKDKGGFGRSPNIDRLDARF